MRKEGIINEKNISTQEKKKEKEPWFSQKDENAGRKTGY